jgi:hypothetical protein
MVTSVIVSWFAGRAYINHSKWYLSYFAIVCSIYVTYKRFRGPHNNLAGNRLDTNTLDIVL